MLTVLTGLPKDKSKDKSILTDFSNSAGQKIICGTSTVKIYCRILNIKPEIIIDYDNALPEAYYKVEGIFLACEGIITLNECYRNLSGKTTKNKNAVILSEALKKENELKFIIGSAQNGDLDFYKLKKLLPRKEIIEKIIDILPGGKKITLINC